mgnify:CR=1 FL=1
MRKKRIILKRSISALVIGAVTISILAGATSASSSVNADDATASVAVFENLLNDRSFVVDTFTQDTMPESNPYGRLDGVANTDYLSTDFLKQYEHMHVCDEKLIRRMVCNCHIRAWGDLHIAGIEYGDWINLLEDFSEALKKHVDENVL